MVVSLESSNDTRHRREHRRRPTGAVPCPPHGGPAHTHYVPSYTATASTRRSDSSCLAKTDRSRSETFPRTQDPCHGEPFYPVLPEHLLPRPTGQRAVRTALPGRQSHTWQTNATCPIHCTSAPACWLHTGSPCSPKARCLFPAEPLPCCPGRPPPLSCFGKLLPHQSMTSSPPLLSRLHARWAARPVLPPVVLVALVSVTRGAALCQIRERTETGPVFLVPSWQSLGTTWLSSVLSALNHAAYMLPSQVLHQPGPGQAPSSPLSPTASPGWVSVGL